MTYYVLSGTTLVYLANKTTLAVVWYAFTTCGHETQQALFLQPWSRHGAYTVTLVLLILMLLSLWYSSNVPVITAMQLVILVEKLFVEPRQFFSTDHAVVSTVAISMFGRLSLLYEFMFLLHKCRTKIQNSAASVVSDESIWTSAT